MFGANAHRADAAVNQMTPISKIAPAPVAVAERAAEQDQRREREQVAVDRPLEAGDVGVEVASELRQRDVDDRGLEERDRRAEHGGREHPATARGGELECGFVGQGTKRTDS